LTLLGEGNPLSNLPCTRILMGRMNKTRMKIVMPILWMCLLVTFIPYVTTWYVWCDQNWVI